MEPYNALQEVTLLAENCCVPPSATVAVAGVTTGAGVLTVALVTGTVSELLCHVPGFET
jgi:hypothetical protein